MSVDLQVFTRRKPRLNRLDQLVPPGTTAEQGGPPRPPSVGAHLLSDSAGVHVEVDGPLRARPDDLPDAAAGAFRREGWLVSLSIKSTADAAWPLDLAVSIAREGEGVVYDPQQDVVIWPKGWAPSGRTSREQRIDVLELTWFVAAPAPDPGFGRQFARLLETHFPAAVPRRYGDIEPFQHSFGGPDAAAEFGRAWAAEAQLAMGMLFWTARRPSLGGFVSMTSPQAVRAPGARACTSVTIRFDARPFQRQPDAAAALSEGFASVARELGCFYAAAVLLRGHILRPHGLSGAGEAGPLPFGGAWVGLPAAPVWLAWFGPPYAPLVRSSVGTAAIEHAGALLLAAGPEPMNATELAEAVPALPAELIARRGPGDARWLAGAAFTYGQPPPSDPARTIPEL